MNITELLIFLIPAAFVAALALITNTAHNKGYQDCRIDSVEQASKNNEYREVIEQDIKSGELIDSPFKRD